MATFVRSSAVLVGMANVFLYSLAGDGELGNAFILNLDPWWPQNFSYAFSAAVAGLLVSGIFLGFARRTLRGTFFARYGVMVLAICLGGAVLSVLLAFVGALFGDGPLAMGERMLEAWSMLPFTVMAGGMLGAAEGVVLAFPLAAFLGRFGDGTAATSGSQA